MSNALLDLFGIDLPIIQAPMAGVATPALAAAVANAGALGSLGIAATNAEGGAKMIREFRTLSNRALNVNVFCHKRAVAKPDIEAAWIEHLRPTFKALGAEPPNALREIYTSFVDDDDLLAMLLAERPKIVSLHFGVPPEERMRALKEAGILLVASATSVAEARIVADAGVDAIVAQGYEAGGHRGIFDPDGPDARLGTMALTRLLVKAIDRPIIAAGGIMDGAGVAAALALGASAAQLGTAFIGCPESQADAGYRAALGSDAAHQTTMTAAISGRPARCLANDFTRLTADVPDSALPDYPITYDIGKALNAAGKAAGTAGYGAQWAGQAAPLARPMPAADLVATLAAELAAARA